MTSSPELQQNVRDHSADYSAVKRNLADKIFAKRDELERWFDRHAQECAPPFYCSVDLRDSGHKIVPVDSNLYPAGFNNLCPDDLRTAAPIVRTHIENFLFETGRKIARRVLLIPEAHTSNLYYIENLYYLVQLIENAGFETRIGWYTPDAPTQEPFALNSATGKTLAAHPVQIEGGVISAGGFVPDLVLLNNDFSAGYPKPLDAVTQPILPSHILGWHSRKKSEHFYYYNRLAAEFAAIIGIDPWSIQVETEEVTPVDFSEEQGTDRVAEAVARVLDHTRKAYQLHSIDRTPFAFVKNNAGTYGMGIMVVHSAEEIHRMNRRTKNKMAIGKGHQHIHSVVVQEGVPTATLVDRLAAEPVIYLVGGELVGGFLRTNKEKGIEDNLNSQGMVFKKLCMSDLRTLYPDEKTDEPILELIYGSIARISALASGMELTQHALNRKTSN